MPFFQLGGWFTFYRLRQSSSCGQGVVDQAELLPQYRELPQRCAESREVIPSECGPRSQVSSQPVTFDRLRNSRPNIPSCPNLGANAASQEGSIEHTNCDSHAATEESCSCHCRGGATSWWKNVQIRCALSPSISARGDCIVALCKRRMAVHAQTATVLSIIGFVDCARKPTHSNVGPGSVR
jgi:hypothetical protein